MNNANRREHGEWNPAIAREIGDTHRMRSILAALRRGKMVLAHGFLSRAQDLDVTIERFFRTRMFRWAARDASRIRWSR